VTRETQILSEAQDLLGRLSWQQAGKIDELTGEFWQLKDKDDQQAKLRAESENLLAKVDGMKEQLDGIENKYDEIIDQLQAKKDGVMDKAADMNADLDELRDDDAATRQRFNSLKSKLEVLKKQEDPSLNDEIEKTRVAMADLKVSHEENKKQIEQREAEVRVVEQSVQGIEKEIAAKREEMRAECAELVSEIGRSSKVVAELSAKIGSLENAKSELSFRIGQFLSNNLDSKNPEIKKVLRNFGPIVDKIVYLKRSIQYNTRLARRAMR
jgi:chromosome segregation ATPase